tara:strand:+ start:200 stop:376 length:177 start_codon:yes stop_codon:yes gene_type:complete
MAKLLKALRDRQAYSWEYWEETYPENKDISNAEETDNESWEIGFYAGLQYAIDRLEEK